MIITITLNPSIDISYRLDKFILDDVNRTSIVKKTPGGKGLNVTRVLNQLSSNVVPTGFLGGYTGEFIEEELEKLGIESKFLKVNGSTRNCIAILHEGKQTEILESGEEITKEEQDDFLKLFKDIAKDSSVITISGSMPPGIETNYYEKIIESLENENKKIILDTSGESLRNIILNSKAKPFCIKPNETEIKQIENKDINTKEELVEYLKSDIFKGIELIVITMGGEGSLVKYKNDFYNIIIPKVEVINPVGSGDSTVAGLAYGLDNNLGINEIIKYGMGCGILNAMEEKTGYINIEKLDDIMEKIIINKL